MTFLVPGFLTLEVRKGGERRGFRLIDFQGREQIIADVGFPMVRSVGKYGVDVDAIDAACSAIELHEGKIDGRSLSLEPSRFKPPNIIRAGIPFDPLCLERVLRCCQELCAVKEARGLDDALE